MGTFLVVLNGSLMNVALPFFASYFEIGLVRAQWLITIFILAMSLGMCLTTYFSKRLGTKNVYMISVFLFMIGSIVGVLATNFEFLLLSRFIQGLAGGILTPLSMAIVFKYFAKNERGTAMGIWGMSIMVAPTIGPFIGGMILDYMHWTYLFALNIPICIVTFILTHLFIKEIPQKQKVSFDWMGFILITLYLSLSLIALDLVFNEANFLNLFLLFLGVVIGILFVIVELKRRNPLIELRTLTNKGFVSSLVLLAINTSSLYGILILLPIIYQSVQNEAATLAGLILIPQALFMGIAMTIGGKMSDQFGAYKVIIAGTVIMALATLSLNWFSNYGNYLLLIIILSLHGIGSGLMSTPSTTAGINSLKEEHFSAGTSINNLFRQLIKVYVVLFITFGYSLCMQIYRLDPIKTVQYIFLVITVLTLLSIFVIKINKRNWT